MKAKVHRASTAGIVPGRLGAYSVVLSGTSYADKDMGDTMQASALYLLTVFGTYTSL